MGKRYPPPQTMKAEKYHVHLTGLRPWGICKAPAAAGRGSEAPLPFKAAGWILQQKNTVQIPFAVISSICTFSIHKISLTQIGVICSRSVFRFNVCGD